MPRHKHETPYLTPYSDSKKEIATSIQTHHDGTIMTAKRYSGHNINYACEPVLSEGEGEMCVHEATRPLTY